MRHISFQKKPSEALGSLIFFFFFKLIPNNNPAGSGMQLKMQDTIKYLHSPEWELILPSCLHPRVAGEAHMR